MTKQISAVILLCISALCAQAQNGTSAAPFKWEKYKVSEREVSVSFPKLPILIKSQNLCREEESSQYAAYSEGVVYGLNVYYKTAQNVPRSYCSPKMSFGAGNFEDRVSFLAAEPDAGEQTKFAQNGLTGVKINQGVFTYWLLNDFNNNRWFELWTAARSTTEAQNLTIKNFVESLKTDKNPAGIEIGEGAPKTRGDEVPQNISTAKPEKETVEKYKIILKPRAAYTKAARDADAQGSVLLKVTLLASGGVGSITVVNGLPFGLTEEAVAAAGKIVFLPMNRNGVNYTVVVPVEYSFILY